MNKRTRIAPEKIIPKETQKTLTNSFKGFLFDILELNRFLVKLWRYKKH